METTSPKRNTNEKNQKVEVVFTIQNENSLTDKLSQILPSIITKIVQRELIKEL